MTIYERKFILEFVFETLLYNIVGMVVVKLTSLFACVTEANQFLDRLATEKGVDCPPPRTTTRLLDKVINHIAACALSHLAELLL